MSTWALRLAGDRKRLALWFTIQGIDTIFKESAGLDCSTILGGGTRAEASIIVKRSIEVGEEMIDPEKGCSVGGSFCVRLRQKRGSTVLDDLFQTRKRRQTSITTNATKTDATISVGDSTWAAANTGLIYIGAETVKHTTRPSSTSFGGLTRGMYGSRAQAHKGSADWKGTAVYDVPPSWLGRRITLYASFVDDAGNSNAAKTTTIGTFTIDENPRQVDGSTWELSAGPLSDEYAGRQMYVGLQDANGTGPMSRLSALSDVLVVPIDNGLTFKPSAGGFVTHALIYFDNWRRSTARISDYGTGEVRVIPDDYFTPSAFRDQRIEDFIVDKVRHICLVRGLPVSSLLPALCSQLGDGANGSYDLLPGAEPVSFGLAGWRMGAGIDEDDIDDGAFAEITTHDWMYVLDKTVTVGDFLIEWALWANAFWFVTAAGLLSCQRQSETTATSVLTIDGSVLVGDAAPEIYVDESTIYPVLEIETNYDPARQDFMIKDVFVDQELLQRYPQSERARSVNLKGIAMNRPGPIPRWNNPVMKTEAEMRGVGRAWQKADARGRLVVKCVTRLKGMKASLGDVVTIGFNGNDYEGGNLNGRKCRVIGRRPSLNDGRVTFTLQVLDPLYLFAPSSTITAVSTTSVANDTVTLSTTAPDVNAEALPTEDFAVGQQVRRWDVSAGASEVLTIAQIISSTQLRFTTGLTLALEASVDWLTVNTLGTNSAIGASANGQTEADWDFQMSDAAAGAAGAVRRWR